MHQGQKSNTWTQSIPQVSSDYGPVLVTKQNTMAQRQPIRSGL